MHRNHLYCKEFIDKSKYVYNWMKKQPSVGEESITDWLLFALSESLTSLKYKTFSRHKEARETGADWEWWFVDDKKALCSRIQAKKLFASKDNYNSLAYTNKYGLQIEKLIDNAKTKNALLFIHFTIPHLVIQKFYVLVQLGIKKIVAYLFRQQSNYIMILLFMEKRK